MADAESRVTNYESRMEMEVRGLEPLAFSLRTRRSTNWAIPPSGYWQRGTVSERSGREVAAVAVGIPKFLEDRTILREHVRVANRLELLVRLPLGVAVERDEVAAAPMPLRNGLDAAAGGDEEQTGSRPV